MESENNTKVISNVAALMSAINEKATGEDRDYDLDTVLKEVMHFPAYLNTVIGYVATANMISLRYDGEEYRDRMTKLDSDRRSDHENVAIAVNKLNKFAEIYKTDPVIPVPHELDYKSVGDRELAVKETFSFCVETFLDEMDRSGYNKEASLDIVMKDLCDKRTHFSTDRNKFLDAIAKETIEHAEGRDISEENIEKPSVLWFSAHEMTNEQREALGDVGQIDQVDRQIQSAYELKDEIKNHDIIAIVAPINLQQQFLKLAEDKPVIMAKSDRILTKDENGREDKVAFKFNKWEQIKNISVKLEDFQPADDKKVLWVSRHEMEPAQMEALGENAEITQVSRTLKNAYELQNEIKEADVIAIVAPVNIQQQFLKLAGDKPVIIAKMDRTDEISPETGEKTVKMSFNKWEQIKSIDIDIADFEPVPEAKEIEQEQDRGEEETRCEKEGPEVPDVQEQPEEEEELEEEEDLER